MKQTNKPKSERQGWPLLSKSGKVSLDSTKVVSKMEFVKCASNHTQGSRKIVP